MFPSFQNNYRNKSDEQLISFVKEGDENAFNELYKRFSKPLFLFFYNRLWQDKKLAEDFLQDLFLKLVNKADSIDIERSFKVWLYTAAYNMCKNEYRRKQSEKNKAGLMGLNSQEYVHVVAKSTATTIDLEDFGKQLQVELSMLDEKYSFSFILRHQYGFSIKEISQIMNCPEGTVKSRLSYGIKLLAKRLRIFKSSI